jgi:inward rectifier potassium channel
MSPAPRLRARGRTFSREGESNVERVGLHRRHFSDMYHLALTASWPKLALLITAVFLLSNALFALCFLATGDGIEGARPGSFSDAFFFSVQTMATIGYGSLAPKTFAAHVVVTAEALIGLTSFAVATGLLFAKFSRPTARVLFSRVAVVGRWRGMPALMFRMANERANQILEATLRVVLAREETTADGESLRRFYDLALERRQSALFALTWTAIHVIDEASPLHGASAESLRAVEAELVASVIGLDETFAQTVHARNSWIADEIVWNARFVDVLSRREDGRRVVDYSRFHETTPLQPPLST